MPPGVGPGQLQVAAAHPVMKSQRLVFEATLASAVRPSDAGGLVRRERQAQLQVADALQSLLRGNVQENGGVRGESGGHIFIQVVNRIPAGSTPESLVGDSGAGVAIGHYVHSPVQGGTDFLGYQLGTGGGEKQQLRFQRQRTLALEILPQVGAQRGSARLTHQHGRVSGNQQSLVEALRLRALSGSLPALEYDEQSLGHNSPRLRSDSGPRSVLSEAQQPA